jgi:MFS family permease
MGVCAYYIGDRAVFLFAAVLAIPALAALGSLREADSPPLRPRPTASPRASAQPCGRSWQFLMDRRLMAFAVCAALFQLANAAMLPIAAAAVTKRAESEVGLIIAACIVGPQLITALLSPWAGRAAEAWGRRPILLLGFSALPIRGILLAGIADLYLIIAIQLFDGLGAAVFGVLFPLIVADVTRDTGNYTTSLGLVGLAIGGGATLSTALAGLAADHSGLAMPS